MSKRKASATINASIDGKVALIFLYFHSLRCLKFGNVPVAG